MSEVLSFSHAKHAPAYARDGIRGDGLIRGPLDKRVVVARGRSACDGRHMEFVFMPRMVKCIKLGREAEALDLPPYPGELGKRIYESVSKEAWKQWLEHQKMLVNENRLSLADKKARDYLVRQMDDYFFGGGADAAAGYTPPRQK